MEDKKYISEVFRIISGALRLDAVKVRNYAEFLADKLEKDGDASTANRLRKLINETGQQLHPAELSVARRIPVDSESRFPLLEIAKPDASRMPIVLSRSQQDVINEFLTAIKCREEFEAKGVGTPTTLLLYGPPGCGKSHLAGEIARDVGLPLHIARLDGLISSYLGSTAKNIRAIFEYAERTPCVLLLDEFDAIAKLRDDQQELGELKRVVNSFLQNLDLLSVRTVIIGASNHPHLLDAAVWRRFSYSLELGLPSVQQREHLWELYSSGLDWTKKELAALVDLSEDYSGADIREACLQLKRKQIVEKTRPELKDAFSTLARLARNSTTGKFMGTLASLERSEIAKRLKSRNPRHFSHAIIGSLLGTSKATAQRLTNEEAKQIG